MKTEKVLKEINKYFFEHMCIDFIEPGKANNFTVIPKILKKGIEETISLTLQERNAEVKQAILNLLSSKRKERNETEEKARVPIMWEIEGVKDVLKVLGLDAKEDKDEMGNKK